ncbi:hypothetical protein EOPP23_06440 [Endozoicomonas sp. OPT23]|uniref:MFS transporter n=1 Tax=Endozoicomonas sp. OPT23 TaxID=2072845 RepID=UPI00129B1E9D|nr:MFS transporter [Endozoicomonas sp. OPT23]MRI32624.1 hypothetical protein [Endozoicomonas sp. OPT23]
MESQFRLRLVTTLSAALEFYDFTLMVFLTPVIGKVFFPDFIHSSQTMLVFTIFFAGYLPRFIGGLLYSHSGDTRGRKRSYNGSIILMSLSTLGIALLPGTLAIGAMAPLLLLLLRVLQGLSLGGEIPGAVVFAAEHSPAGKRGLVTGLIVSGVTAGNVLATGAIAGFYFWFGESAMIEWGWRILFAFGSLLGLLSFWLRSTFTETPVFEKRESIESQIPLKQLLTKHRLELLRGSLVSAVPATCISTLFFLPNYQFNYLQDQQSPVFTSFNFFLSLTLLSLFVAWCSDRTGRLPMMRAGALIMLMLPFTVTLLRYELLPAYIAFLPLLLAGGLVMGIYESSMVELFPTGVRFSGVAFSHNLAFAFIGGATPLTLEWLCQQGFLLAPAVLPAAFAVLLLIVSRGWKDKYRENLVNISSTSNIQQESAVE